MVQQALIKTLVDEFIQTHGVDLFPVDVVVHPGNRIVVEVDNEKGVFIDDCVALSKYIESKLEREVEDFELEVGSCGLTSPFKVLRQYTKNIDGEIEVLRKGGVKEKGILKSADDDKITLQVERMVKPEGEKRKRKVEALIEIPMSEILQAKRVIKI